MQNKRSQDEPQVEIPLGYNVDGVECTKEEFQQVWSKKWKSLFDNFDAKPQNEFEQEEWTEYYVNGIECKREDIYQIILDNQFYDGVINLDKKYHFKKHEKEVTEEKSNTTSPTEHGRKITTKNNSKSINANFNLDTKEFAAKVGPTSDEYKLLVERMVNTLDTFLECQKNYKDNANNLHAAIINCLQMVLEKISAPNAPYNNVQHELTLEQFAMVFDLLVYALSKITVPEDDFIEIKIPTLDFDTSSINESWNEQWSNIKKSQYLDKYLSLMLKQTDVTGEFWLKSDLFQDDASKKDIHDKFDAFKTLIKSLQTKKASLDASYKVSSFLHFKRVNPLTHDSSVNVEVSCSPKR